MANNTEIRTDSTSSLANSLSNLVILAGESHKELNRIKHRIEIDLRPMGAIEEILCSKIIADNWKLRRFYALETQILRKQQAFYRTHDDADAPWSGRTSEKRFRSTIKQIDYSSKLESIQKHQAIIETGLFKTISEFRSIQRDRLKAKK